MDNREIELFKALCSFKKCFTDKSLLESASAEVLGQLFFNRMQGVAYGNLLSRGLADKVNREFRNSLFCGYEFNKRKNEEFFCRLDYVGHILSKFDGKYALLKGAYLCGSYPDGYRTSNDIDILVEPKDVGAVGELLGKAGFLQGRVVKGEFVPATRREIIESRMTRGETVPYFKEVVFTQKKYIEADVNFSLGYKSEDGGILKQMLSDSGYRKVKNTEVMTLSEYDFLCHLCCHLYKEATTLPWVEMKRDMTLYKYCDIYMLTDDYDEQKTAAFFERAKQLHIEDVCAFAILQTGSIFDFNGTCVTERAKEVLGDRPDFLHRVVSPKDNKIFYYKEKDVLKRFFSKDRRALLQEEK